MEDISTMPLKELMKHGILGLGWVFAIVLHFRLIRQHDTHMRSREELIGRLLKVIGDSTQSNTLLAERIRAFAERRES